MTHEVCHGLSPPPRKGSAGLLDNLVALLGPATHVPGHHDLAERAQALLGVPADLTREVLSMGTGGPSTIADPTALLERYIAAVDRIWEFVDEWKRQ